MAFRGSVSRVAEMRWRGAVGRNTLETGSHAICLTSSKIPGNENPITDAEVERAKAQILKLTRTWRLRTFRQNRAVTRLAIGPPQGDWRLYFLSRDAVGRVDVDQVRVVRENTSSRNNRTSFVHPSADRTCHRPGPLSDLNVFVERLQRNVKPSPRSGERFRSAIRVTIEKRVFTRELNRPLSYAQLLPKRTRGGIGFVETHRFDSAPGNVEGSHGRGRTARAVDGPRTTEMNLSTIAGRVHTAQQADVSVYTLNGGIASRCENETGDRRRGDRR